MKRKIVLLLCVTAFSLTGCTIEAPDFNRKIIASKNMQNISTETMAEIKVQNAFEKKTAENSEINNDTITNVYNLLSKLGVINVSTKKDAATMDELVEDIIGSGYSYEDFSVDKIQKGSICIKDSTIAVCMSVNENTYTMYIYDKGIDLAPKTLTGQDIEKYNFDKIFVFKGEK